LGGFLEHLGIHGSTTETGRSGHDAGLAVTTDATHTDTNGGVHGGATFSISDD